MHARHDISTQLVLLGGKLPCNDVELLIDQAKTRRVFSTVAAAAAGVLRSRYVNPSSIL